MQNLYGIKGIKVKVFENFDDDVNKVNNFLSEHDGNIIDVQIVNCDGARYCYNKVMIVYKE